MPVTPQFCPRDERGWRIPRDGSLARRIYEHMRVGMRNWQIAEMVGRRPNYVGVVRWKIINPGLANLMCGQGMPAIEAKRRMSLVKERM